MIASGADALFDAILSASVLASALIYISTGISLEAYVGLVISIMIIKAGVEMILDTVNEILGRREDSGVTNKIKSILCEEPEVRGAYDLTIYNYGPNKNLGSVHIELPDTMTVKEVDELTRRVEDKVYKETGVILAGVGVYSYNTGNDHAAQVRVDIRKRLSVYKWIIQIHGFFIDEETKSIRFDAVISFDIEPREGLRIIQNEMQTAYPDYSFKIRPDLDVSVTQ